MLTKKQEQLIDRHLRYVLAENQKVNLTAITDYKQARILHVEDSLAGLQEINEEIVGELCDMGSGAGYPGIPLAIATGRQTTLVESTEKKVKVIQKFLEQENLTKQISVVNERIEDFSKANRERFQIVTARALSSLSALLELAAPLLAIGGVFVAYKTQEQRQQANVVTAGILEKLGFEEGQERAFLLSDGETRRQIIKYRKVANPRIPLPRRNGMAQHRPLRG
jgi:16S rRNA (guanine527-N7)-methyltransferase